MKIRHVRIRNFRAIRSLDWSIDARFAVLIGSGDAGKSTVLDALALAVSLRWNPPLSDADFHRGDTASPVVIEVTLTEPPAALVREDRYGHWLRGIASDGSLHREPDSDHEMALTVRLTVDSSLEPVWEVIRASDEDGVRIGAADRGRLGVFRLSDAGSAHLRWSRDSALTRLGEAGEVNEALLQAHRAARAAVFATPPEGLAKSATAAGEAIEAIGGARLTQPRPGLDPTAGQRAGSLLLHDGDVPTTFLGLGSQRLAGIAFQLEALDEHSVALIDEVEIGLEPHRLRHLVRHLKRREAAGAGQVIVTTHSPVVVEEVEVTDLNIVRRDAEHTSVLPVPKAIEGLGADEPQATARGGAAALLARRIVVCEGPTEVGLCRALVDHWDKSEATPAALIGTVHRNGHGNSAPTKAECLATLGYAVALLSDHDLSRREQAVYERRLAAARRSGVLHLTWDRGAATEDQIARSLPVDAVRQLIALAVELNESDDPEMSVRAAVAARLGDGTGRLEGLDPVEWCRQARASPPAVRAAIGAAARSRGWFKSETRGSRLGALVAPALPALQETDPLRATLDRLRRFVYGHREPECTHEGAPVG